MFCFQLRLDHQRVRDWCLVHAVLDALWDLEDGRPWWGAITYAEHVVAMQ
jgi:hypothetical protein